jgi:hypothetical protein
MRARARCAKLVESSLEDGFLPDSGALASFLINAIYLFGDEAIAVHGSAPEGLAAELNRLGHRVSPVPPGREPRLGTVFARAKDGWLAAPRKAGGFDRAVMLNRALGRGEDAEILERLRDLRRSVRPGGLVCFHVFDRDRAWSLTGGRAAGSGNARVTIGFDPATGRITARAAEAAGMEAPGPGTAGAAGIGNRLYGRGVGDCGRLAVKAWNRPEIEALLRGAGLKLERLYGDWEGNAPEAAATGRLIVVATKPRRARKSRIAQAA